MACFLFIKSMERKAKADKKISQVRFSVLDCPMHGITHKGEFPDDIKAAIQYGDNLNALAVAMNTIGAVSLNRTHEILSGVFNIPISSATINTMVNKCASGLNGTTEKIRQKLIDCLRHEKLVEGGYRKNLSR